MGRVFLGRSPGGRLVAVKVVHAELVRRPEFRSRFSREVQAARMVSGAFTAAVIDADPDAPLPWLVTSYIAGPSLEQAVAGQGPLQPGAVLALAAGLAEALVSIHSAGLVHRDLKPSNVLLAEDGPRVIDFGIVRTVEADSITRTGHMAGSPGFMSPEQVSGAEVTPASDVFCLGAVLAFAATGGNPFGDGPTPALLYRVVHNEPDVESIADPALRTLISECLTKDPADRPTPREIMAGIGAAGAPGSHAGRPSHTGLAQNSVRPPDDGLTQHAGHPSQADQWPAAADPTRAPHTDAAAFADTAAVNTGSLPADTAAPDAGPHPPASSRRAAPPPQSTPTLVTPHPETTHPPTMVDPTHPAPQVDTAPPPPPGEPAGPIVDGDPLSGPGDRGRRGRRAFLLSGVGAVAAIGTGAGYWLTRSAADEEGADADRAGSGTGASASPSAAARRPRPVGVWPLDEASGTVARDTAGGNNGTATAVGWRSGNGGAAEFDGKSSQIVTAGQVLKTAAGRSFTVSAWVYLPAEPGHFATAVSQDGAENSGFYLQYSSTEKRWAFARPDLGAVGYSVPAVGAWTHLVGVCEGPARRLRLYVNGAQEAAKDDTNPTAAPGALVIGRARYHGQPSDFFPGAIKDVRVFQKALTTTEVKRLR
jgi:serine/threonine protein kinase